MAKPPINVSVWAFKAQLFADDALIYIETTTEPVSDTVAFLPSQEGGNFVNHKSQNSFLQQKIIKSGR